MAYHKNIIVSIITKKPTTETPPNKMGVISTDSLRTTPVVKNHQDLEFRVDWLQGTFPTEKFEIVKNCVTSLLGGGEFTLANRGTRCFAYRYDHPSGVIMAQGHRGFYGDINEQLSYLEIKGEHFPSISMSELHKLFKVLFGESDFNSTRQDICIDDYGMNLDFDLIRDLRDKRHFTGFRKAAKDTSYGPNSEQGREITFGNRGKQGSGKRIQFYDKCKETKGKVPCHRIELSLSQDYSRQLFQQMACASFSEWGNIIKGWISGAIDFIYRQGKDDKNPQRRTRYSWWDYYVGDAVKLRPGRSYKDKTIETIKLWWYHQIAPSLAVLITVLGKEDIKDFIDFLLSVALDGYNRFNDKHLRLIDSS